MDQVNVDTYRLSSLDEPTDDQLKAIMQEVGELGRKTMLLAQQELNKRLMAVGQNLSTPSTDLS